MKLCLKLMLLMTMVTIINVDRGLALQLYFDDNVDANTLIDNRQSLAGRFDIRSKIKGFRTGATENYFNRGTLHFAFKDDNDLTGAGYYHSRWERKLIGNMFHFERRQYNVLRDSFEMIQIDALGKTTYKHTGFYSSEEKSDLQDKIMVDDAWGSFGATYRTEMYNAAIGWGGRMNYSMALDEYWLAKISATGLLQYDLKSIMGDMILQSARLELGTDAQAASVPEPSTFLLVITSAGVVFGGSRFRKFFAHVRPPT